ncbi:medium-chain acyl-CoA ligase ACSF2, mitochondrial-like, partial [Saccoglossus kowalevskii]|uniref:Acyl-CoA synthetase family member 2, mitochondrial-like n=1 Tax=Saccoglossus kowalevskii TaxID=10224 RepID=A0ABM0GXM8_SACKO
VKPADHIMLTAKINKSYYHSTSNVPLAAVTVKDMLDSVVEKIPDKEAYVFPVEKIRLTFAELQRQVNALATGFINMGLKRGDTLGILSSRATEYVLVQLAAAQIGVILARFHIGLPHSMLENVILKSECVALVVGDNHDDVYNQLMKIIPDLKTTDSGLLPMTGKSKLQFIITKVAASGGRWKSIDDIMNKSNMDPEKDKKLLEETSKMVEFGDLYTIFYTSGSTGPLKGTLHSNEALQNIYMMCGDRYGWTKDDILLSACPSLSHVAADVAHTTPLVLGLTSVILSPGANIQDNVSVIHDERCSLLFATYPGLYNMLYSGNVEQYNCNSVRHILTGASIIPADFIQKISTIFQAKVLNTYASSEALAVSGIDPTDDGKGSFDNVGRPFSHTEVKIVDTNGKIVPINTLGDLFIRSNYVFRSYIHDEDKTKKVKSVNGWYKSGDIAKINSNGYITVVGRNQDIIMKGAQTMYYASLVESILSHPNVKAAYIVPVPDKELQEDFCACVSLNGNTVLSGDELRDFYVANIAMKDYIPKYVMVFNDFPKNATGKIDQIALSQEVFISLGLDTDWLVHGRKA